MILARLVRSHRGATIAQIADNVPAVYDRKVSGHTGHGACVVLMLWLIGANTSIIPSVERTDETSHSIWTRLKGLSRFRNCSFFYSRNSTTLAHRLCQVLQLGLNCKGMFPQCFFGAESASKTDFNPRPFHFYGKSTA